ncbi:MAG: hypothetical protein U5P10_15035 [Spirochaetia bacterium]|nr:hypothetical protein [Spirochaetia bacterium]
MEEFIDYVYHKYCSELSDKEIGDSIFLSNDQLWNEYAHYYGDRSITKTSLTRILKRADRVFEEYNLYRTSRTIKGWTYRGFEIRRIIISSLDQTEVNRIIHTSELVITLHIGIEQKKPHTSKNN